jgi:mercuric ion binding protein
MRIIILFIFLIVGLKGWSQNQDTLQIQTSAICEMCKETLEYELTFTKGVKFVELDLSNKVLTIAYKSEKTNPDKLREVVARTGYHADWVPRDSVAYEGLPFCCKDGSHGTSRPQVPMKKPGTY